MKTATGKEAAELLIKAVRAAYEDESMQCDVLAGATCTALLSLRRRGVPIQELLDVLDICGAEVEALVARVHGGHPELREESDRLTSIANAMWNGQN